MMQEKFTRKIRPPYRLVDVAGHPIREVDPYTDTTYILICDGLWGTLEHDYGNGTVVARVEVEDIERLIMTVDYDTGYLIRAKFDCPLTWENDTHEVPTTERDA